MNKALFQKEWSNRTDRRNERVRERQAVGGRSKEVVNLGWMADIKGGGNDEEIKRE